MVSRDTLASGLKNLMETARQEYGDFLQFRGIQFTVPEQRLAIIDNEDMTGWHSEYREVIISSAQRHLMTWPGFSEELKNSTLDLAADFAATFTETLPFFASQFGSFRSWIGLQPGQSDFKSEPNFWITEQIIIPAIVEYLRDLDSLAAADSAKAARIADDALYLAASTKLEAVSYLPVYGINTQADPLVSGDISVRALTPLERGAIWSQSSVSVPEPWDVIYSARLTTLIPSHIIEVKTTSPRMEYPQTGTHYQAVLCAFYLHGYPLAGRGMMTSSAAPAWTGFGRIGTPIQLPSLQRGRKDLDQEQLNEVWRTLTKLRNYNFGQPLSPRDLSLHRFVLGSGRESATDSLLDFTIALECLFLPYDPSTRQGELAYRFRLHGAHYIATSKSERREVWKQLRDLYDTRSRLVHGAEYPTTEEVATKVATARNLAEQALLKAVRSHFPRVEEFNAMILGETSQRS